VRRLPGYTWCKFAGGGAAVISTQADYDAYVLMLKSASVGHDAAVKFANAKFGRTAATVDVPVIDEAALEKAIEHAGDTLMAKLGFEIIRFSHPGKTKQTPGISDRRYYRRPRTIERRDGSYHRPAIACWWEAKSATGEQRPGQKVFQELVMACGEHYVLGTLDALVAWLIDQRIAVRVGDTLEPYDDAEMPA
jgi:hypothetical protein